MKTSHRIIKAKTMRVNCHWGEYDLTLGCINTEAKRIFTCGHCHSLAIVIHKITMWKYVTFLELEPGEYESRLKEEYASELIPQHVAILTPNRKVLDIYGISPLKDLKDKWGYTLYPPDYFVESDFDGGYLKHDIKMATPFAEVLLQRFHTAFPSIKISKDFYG